MAKNKTKRRKAKSTERVQSQAKTTGPQQNSPAPVRVQKEESLPLLPKSSADRSLEERIKTIATSHHESSALTDKSGHRYFLLILFVLLTAILLFSGQFIKPNKTRWAIMWAGDFLFLIHVLLKFAAPGKWRQDSAYAWMISRLSFASVTISSLLFFAVIVSVIEFDIRTIVLFSQVAVFGLFAIAVLGAVYAEPYRLTNDTLTMAGSNCMLLMAHAASLFLIGNVGFMPIRLVMIISSFAMSTLLIALQPRATNNLSNVIQYIALRTIHPLKILASISIKDGSLRQRLEGLAVIAPLIDRQDWVALKAINEEIIKHSAFAGNAKIRGIIKFLAVLFVFLTGMAGEAMWAMLEPIIQQAWTQKFAKILCYYFEWQCGFKITP